MDVKPDLSELQAAMNTPSIDSVLGQEFVHNPDANLEVMGELSTLPPSITQTNQPQLQNQNQNQLQNQQNQSQTQQTPNPSKLAPPTTFPSYMKGMFPRVQNMIATINTGSALELKTIALGTRNAEYNPKRFSGVIVRIRDPKTTALIFASGKIVCAGAKSETDCLLAMKKFVLILQRLGFKEASLGSFKVHNVVGCSDVRFPIRLESLAVEQPNFCTYEPELFPGLVFRMVKPKICVIVFVSGKIVLTGGKSKQELNEAFLNIYPVLVGFCKDSYKGQVMSRGPPPEKPSFLTKGLVPPS